MGLKRSAETDDFWRAFVAAHPSVTGSYDVVAFGDTPAASVEHKLRGLVKRIPGAHR